MIYVLYNPFAGNKTCKEQSRKLTNLCLLYTSPSPRD